jgi:hypothetical protein
MASALRLVRLGGHQQHPDWVGAGEAVEQPQPLPPVAFT